MLYPGDVSFLRCIHIFYTASIAGHTKILLNSVFAIMIYNDWILRISLNYWTPSLSNGKMFANVMSRAEQAASMDAVALSYVSVHGLYWGQIRGSFFYDH